MSNPGLMGSGIVLILIGLVGYFVPIENMLPAVESNTSTEDVCSMLEILLPPRYKEYCDISKDVMDNPSPLVILGSYASLGVGVVLLIIGAVTTKKPKEPKMFMCKECDFAFNTEADLHNHRVEKHKKEDE